MCRKTGRKLNILILMFATQQLEAVFICMEGTREWKTLYLGDIWSSLALTFKFDVWGMEAEQFQKGWDVRFK